jgi:hypothetical protein
MSTGIAAELSCTTSPSTSGALTYMKRELTLSSVISGAREAATNRSQAPKGSDFEHACECRIHRHPWRKGGGVTETRRL